MSNPDNWNPEFRSTDNALFAINEGGNRLMDGEGIQRGYMVAQHMTLDDLGGLGTGHGAEDAIKKAAEAQISPSRLHFMWNPSELQKTFEAMIGIDKILQADVLKNMSSPGQTEFQFAMLFNREIERARGDNGAQFAQGSPGEYGVLHDLQVFEDITGVKSSGGAYSGVTMQSRFINVFFSKYLRFSGWIQGATVTFAKFDHKYIPTMATIQVQMYVLSMGLAANANNGGLASIFSDVVGTVKSGIDHLVEAASGQGSGSARSGSTPVTTSPNTTPVSNYNGVDSPVLMNQVVPLANYAPIGRHVWGAPHADLLDTKPAAALPLNQIIIHHVGGGYISTDQEIAACRNIDSGTKAVDGGAIVYNYMVGLSGKAYEARGLHMSAATLNYNATSLTICALGNFMTQDVTPELLQGIQNMISWLVSNDAISAGAAIGAHKDFGSTACCGDNLYKYVHAGFFTAIPLSSMPAGSKRAA